jgi:hypothetical protein
MKTKYIWISFYVLYLLFFPQILKAEYVNCVIETKFQSPFRVSVGWNISGLTLDIPLGKLRYRGSQFSNGVELGFEYRKPESLYFELHATGSLAREGFKATYKQKEVKSEGSDPFLCDLALQVGYNFLFRENWLITPYAALGNFFLGFPDHSHRGFEETMGYIGIGMKGDYSFEEGYDVGFNLQFFRNFSGHKKFKNDELDLRGWFRTPGVYLGFPGKVYLGSCFQWDVKCEPYILALSLGEKQLAYGIRLSTGYHF